MRRKLLIAGAGVLCLVAGVGVAAAFFVASTPEGGLDTDLEGVSVVGPETTTPTTEPTATPTETRETPPETSETTTDATPPTQGYAYSHPDRVCWPIFGRDARRSLAAPELSLGKPTRPFWVRGLGSYIEYPPSYCDGRLYVNTFKGRTYAINAHNGKTIWTRQNRGHTPSTPAIAGKRIIVSSTGGTVTAYHRANGRLLWQFRIRAKVESSPVVAAGTVFFGATDGRMFAIAVRTGRVRWAYQTGGRINASPVIVGPRVCITTYAGTVLCLRRSNGRMLWRRSFRRDVLRRDSFYASASSDGRRLFTLSRAGRLVALAVGNGRTLWSHKLPAWGYTTPAVSEGRVFVGDFTGTLRAYHARTGGRLWSRRVGGRILGAPFVTGKLVLFSTLETKTYALRVSDGRIVWRLGIGKYSPGIATDRHYFFSLNGILMGYWGTRTAVYGAEKTRYVRVAELLKR